MLDQLTLAKKINEYVHTVCCFGSTNQNKAAEAQKQFRLFIKALTAIFVTHRLQCVRSLTLKECVELNNIYDKKYIKHCSFHDDTVFKAGETMFVLPLGIILNSKNNIMSLVHKVYPFDKNFKFSSLKPTDLYAYFASALYDESSLLPTVFTDEHI